MDYSRLLVRSLDTSASEREVHEATGAVSVERLSGRRWEVEVVNSDLQGYKEVDCHKEMQ